MSALHLFLWSCSLREDKILRSRKYHTDCFYVCNRFVRHQPRHCLLDDRLVFRINDDCEEGSDAQRAVRVEQPSERQNREHLRRKEGVSHRHAKLAAAHPVEIILRIRPHLLRQPRIGGLPLIERLDDLVKLNKELKIMIDKKNKQTKKDEGK